jgi:hypothetical protein
MDGDSGDARVGAHRLRWGTGRAGTLAAPSGTNALGAAAARDRMPILAVAKWMLWVSR